MLIAEIGNCHFGSIHRAKELVRLAHNSGADLIKGQAFRAIDLEKHGTMPAKFYQRCQFMEDQYIELIAYARALGNDMFFSIFSHGFDRIRKVQAWHKVAAVQTRAGEAKLAPDEENVIISVPLGWKTPRVKKASVLHVSEYCTTSPNLHRIQELADDLGRPAGYSDHTFGITNAVMARRMWGANIIEKHFCLVKNESFDGILFRDTAHGATPRELEQLAKELQR